MQVSEVMTRASITESPAESLRAAASRMWNQQTGSLLLMEGDELLDVRPHNELLRIADTRHRRENLLADGCVFELKIHQRDVHGVVTHRRGAHNPVIVLCRGGKWNRSTSR